MPITHHPTENIFHLHSDEMSYAIQIVRGYPVHLHWGKRLRDGMDWSGMLPRVERASFSPNPVEDDYSISLDTLPQEYPQYGTSDFREPAYQVQLADGTRITELQYRDHRIYAGKPKLQGLPAVYAESDSEADTLELTLGDDYSGLTVTLSYTVFARMNVVTRSVRLQLEREASEIRVLRALSASVDFHDRDYDCLYLAGAWTRERHVQRRPVAPGGTRIESRRGASSHNMNPFLALVRPNADEDQGDAYGFSLVYSGNFMAQAEVDQFDMTRVSIGLNPFDFSWKLSAGETFQTPEAVLVYSPEGLGGMSRTYHRLYRTRLCRGTHRDKPRPILVNNWEATYFNFNADKIESIAKAGAELGIELFVLDDGWFGKRDNDHSSLGDWVVDRKKLPNGLRDLAERVNAAGLQFGLWFEPEMVSPDSDLYRAHPDWCLHVPGRRRTPARRQLILDLSRQDVRDYLYGALSDIFSTCPISYVKWDMNRNMSEIGSALLPEDRQTETAHRYMLGLYELLGRITSAYPHILFESCSGGGGRFDPGLLYYMPQTWTSDDTDAIERLKIQYGTSMVYPVSSMGAHVSDVPNHQVGRRTSLEIRGDVAMSGNFGYELDLTKFDEAEKAVVKRQVAAYKELRGLIQTGDLYRLRSPFEGNETAWMFVSEDRREAVAFYFRTLAEPNPPLKRFKLRGLDPALGYVIDGVEGKFAGDRLMNFGFNVPQLHGDFASLVLKLKAE
ncbi:alpha-galactosidase [Cohnella sp. CFH 77786]|uniref:alpha-galactosidase n=1 Tax=Cohnella sp. CFH 77786 TaxID=2662265 RepID=UPI001C609B1F|nr:alpha-galactosidase [Cohnella sp. CFH 77786]MBW5449294.1 alpha-galactosidase [Cohnella sp. CFH 77786]